MAGPPITDPMRTHLPSQVEVSTPLLEPLTSCSGRVRGSEWATHEATASKGRQREAAINSTALSCVRAFG
jgi:hypothetical protein